MYISQVEFNKRLLSHGLIVVPIEEWRTAYVYCYDNYGYLALAKKKDFIEVLLSMGYTFDGDVYDSSEWHIADEFCISTYKCKGNRRVYVSCSS